MKRSNEEYILLALCVAGVFGITPFAVLRISQAQWLLGIIDSLLVVGVIFIGVYVWKHSKVRVPSIILTFFYMLGMIAVIYVKGSTLIYWAFPTMTAAYFLIKPKEAAILNVFAMILLIPALTAFMQAIEMSSFLVTLILNNIFSFIFAQRMQLHHENLALQATRDPLTGAGNRRLFDEKISHIVALCKRIKGAACLIMLDIDHFKHINDNYGHTKGDEVLVGLVEVLSFRLRETDGLYRLGGEEFAILPHEIDSVCAFKLAEELRQLVEKTDFLEDTDVTISLGIAEYDGSGKVENWLERADNALYQAKNSGRNRTCN